MSDHPHMTVRIPVMPDDDCQTVPRRAWPPTKRPVHVDEPRIRKLFATGGALEGKKRFAYLIRGFEADGSVDYFLPGDEFPLPTSKPLEALFTMALFHSLGWPDKGSIDMLADGVYHQYMLATELDEAQHYDPRHYFNTLPGKESYQSERDARVSLAFLERGYFVLRVRACDYLRDTDAWVDVTPEEAYIRTRKAVVHFLAVRDTLLASMKPLYPRILVWPDSNDRVLARTTFRADAVERELLTKGARIDRRSWVEAQRLARQAARRGDLRRCSAPSTVELSEAIEQLPVEAFAGLGFSDTEETEYTRYWNRLFVGYNSAAVLDARSEQFSIDLAAKRIKPQSRYK